MDDLIQPEQEGVKPISTAVEPAGVMPRAPHVGEDVSPLAEDPFDLSGFEADEGSELDVMGGSDWHYLDVVDEGSNIIDRLDEQQLAELSDYVIREYKIDDESRKDAVTAYDSAMDAARAKVETKNYPFQNAANVKYPLLTVAALQFQARAYPAIVKGADVVKARVNGKDDEMGTKAARAARISEHMSYQVLEEMPEWEKQIDELLMHLPLAGTAFRCVYYDDEMGRNATELVNMKDFVINNDARSLADCPRYTRLREFYPYQINEKMRSGYYAQSEGLFDSLEDMEQKPQVILEQHRRHDLDGDGYAEPYVVTVHKESRQVLRVVPSADLDTLLVDEDEEGQYIRASKHEPMYVRYIFMPDPEGKIYGVGFGKLLESIGSAINTVLNQILDAAHLQNAGGGFLGGNVDFGKRREVRSRPGDWQQLKATGGDIRGAIVPHQWPGPSSVLFNVLGLLVEMGKEVGSIKDVLSGDSSGANMPVGTTMALIEQGLQQFTAIYKRIYRSLTDEYRLLYRLNGHHMQDEQYFSFHDSEKAVARADYAEGDFDVSPTSDPTAVTTMQKMSKVEFALQFKGQPHIDDAMIDKRAFEAAGIEDSEELFRKPDPAQQEMEMRAAQLEMEKLEAEVAKIQSESIKNASTAESLEQKTEIAEADLILKGLAQGASAIADEKADTQTQ